MKIAIVNDDSNAVNMLCHLVETSGNQVAWLASCGEEAIELCQQTLPDLVLMDMNMPSMNGIAATKQIMGSSPCAILVVTSSITENASMVFEAIGEGAIDAVTTPVRGEGNYEKQEKEFFKKLRQIEKLLNLSPIRRVSRPVRATGQVDVNLLAIGSSTGGPNAVAKVIGDLPVNFPAAIVVIQHVDEAFADGFAKWLDTQTSLKVKTAEDGDQLQKGMVYIASTNNHLIYDTTGRLKYSDAYQDVVYRPSVDVFFNSLNENYRGKILAVLLTGMGKDGAKGLLGLRKQGSYTISQDEETCAVYGMPRAAAEIGAAQFVLPLDKIAQVIIQKIKNLK